MKELQTTSLFNLESFQHKEIFSLHIYPWEVLSRISDFLKNMPLGHIEVKIPDGVYLENPESISIGSGTIIERGAYIKGPCVIGRKAIVRHGAYIRGDVIAGDHVVIGHDTEVKHSIFLNHAKAAHFAYVGDSILGNVNLGAGTILANLRFDHAEITIPYKNEYIKTGRKKLGAILADGAQTGCNSVLNPGTILLKNSTCMPCQNIGGVS